MRLIRGIIFRFFAAALCSSWPAPVYCIQLIRFQLARRHDCILYTYPAGRCVYPAGPPLLYTVYSPSIIKKRAGRFRSFMGLRVLIISRFKMTRSAAPVTQLLTGERNSPVFCWIPSFYNNYTLNLTFCQISGRLPLYTVYNLE